MKKRGESRGCYFVVSPLKTVPVSAQHPSITRTGPMTWFVFPREFYSVVLAESSVVGTAYRHLTAPVRVFPVLATDKGASDGR